MALARGAGPDGVRAEAAVCADVAVAAGLLPEVLDRITGGGPAPVAELGADFYVVLPDDRLAQVLAPRDD